MYKLDRIKTCNDSIPPLTNCESYSIIKKISNNTWSLGYHCDRCSEDSVTIIEAIQGFGDENSFDRHYLEIDYTITNGIFNYEKSLNQNSEDKLIKSPVAEFPKILSCEIKAGNADLIQVDYCEYYTQS